MPFADKHMRNVYETQRKARLRNQWLLANGPCKACGSTIALEVDHIDPRQKVSHRIWGWCKEKREAELAKCQVLCGDCHLRKTISERHAAHPLVHGTNRGYNTHRCRCQACKAAHAALNASYR